MPATTMTALEAAAAVKAQSEKKNAGMKLKGTPLFKGSDTLAISDLNWYTTADNIVEVAGKAGIELRRKDVVFAEHKVNGKTKGSVIISCHKEDAASQLAQWFHNNDFQGKRINPSFVNPAAGHPFKPTGGVSAGPRPVLNTQILLAHGPTNAHGGVNFNRVKPARLAQQVQAQAAVQALGMGWPTSLYKSKAYLSHHNHMGDDGLGHSSWNNHGLHPYAHPFVPSGMGAEYSQ